MRKYILLFLALFISSVVFADMDPYTKKLRKGFEYINTGDYNKAAELFKELIKQDETRPEAPCGLAITEIARGNYEEARKILNDVIDRNSGYSESYYLMGVVEEQLKNYSSALEYYSKYLKMEPESVRKEKVKKRIRYLKEKLD
jgi:tetratricopeptide (TPR) repeat protein